MRKVKFEEILKSKFFVLLVSFVSVILSLAGHGRISFLLLVLISIVYLWTTRWQWAIFGIRKSNSPVNNIVFSAAMAVILAVFAILVKPVIESSFGVQDLSYFDVIRGDFKVYLIVLIQVWIMAAFFEEFIFRGYLLPIWVSIFGKESKQNILLGSIVCSIVFGLGHFYQGWSGVILSGTIGFLLCLIFYYNKKNLIRNIIIHGLVDTIFITLVYLDLDKYLI